MLVSWVSSFLFFVVLSPNSLVAQERWVPISIPSADESSSLARLEAAGIDALAWTTALVDVSDFNGVESWPLATLSSRLTPEDPRWDPWLKEVSVWFHPRSGLSQIWVPAGRASDAVRLLGAPRALDLTPPIVTGWLLIFFTALYGVLFLVAGFLSGWPQRQKPGLWLWIPLSAAFLAGGCSLVGNYQGEAGLPVSSVSWLQHRWFQEAWPWGAHWSDWEPGRPWSYRSYEHRDGRLVEVTKNLVSPDSGWAEATWKGLDRRHAARILGSEIP